MFIKELNKEEFKLDKVVIVKNKDNDKWTAKYRDKVIFILIFLLNSLSKALILSYLSPTELLITTSNKEQINSSG